MKSIVLFAFAAALFAARDADACTCGSSPPCDTIASYGAVFVADVEQVDPSDPADIGVTVTVREQFRGSVGATEVVHTDAYCGVGFQAGKQYIIYAHRRASGELSVSMCSPTRIVNNLAKPDLAYLRSLKNRTY